QELELSDEQQADRDDGGAATLPPRASLRLRLRLGGRGGIDALREIGDARADRRVLLRLGRQKAQRLLPLFPRPGEITRGERAVRSGRELLQLLGVDERATRGTGKRVRRQLRGAAHALTAVTEERRGMRHALLARRRRGDGTDLVRPRNLEPGASGHRPGLPEPDEDD